MTLCDPKHCFLSFDHLGDDILLIIRAVTYVRNNEATKECYLFTQKISFPFLLLWLFDDNFSFPLKEILVSYLILKKMNKRITKS